MRILLRNPFGVELRQLHVAIKQCDGQQVGKAVVGIFFCMDVGFRTEASTAGVVLSTLNHIGFDAHDVGGIKWVHLV